MDQSANIDADRLDIRKLNITGYKLVASNAGQTSVLANATGAQIRDSNFSIVTNIDKATKSTLDVLYQRVAPNAILNDGGRADNPKCHPGTREELIGLIEKWADSAESDRILWLSGPAGGGKTAIIRTIIERAANRGIHTINFFFFRGDSTRQSIQPVVPTLLYQFFKYYPPCREAVAEVIYDHPRILDGSIAQQCELISLLRPIIRQSSPAGTPIVLIIDGLDECDVDAERSQGDILCALEGLLMEEGSPFRLLIASRPEACIKMAFNQLSLHAQTIFLDGQYRPEEDIQHFVVAEFDRIKACHPSAHRLPPNWPSSSDIEEIVRKSSGQFVFAATVMRYIAHPSTVPSLSLERVKGIVPTLSNSPFMHLDSIYVFILSRVDDLDAVLAMFSLEIARRGAPIKWLSECNSRYTIPLLESCVSELSAIVELTTRGTLAFYHASFPDFLVDKTRSGQYWIDVHEFAAQMLPSIWNKPVMKGTNGLAMGCLQHDLLQELDTTTVEITQALFTSPLPDWWYSTGLKLPIIGSSFIFFQQIQRLYYNKDEETYCNIILQYIPQWAQSLARRGLMDDRHKQYLNYLSTGGLAEWASTVGHSNVAQYSITSILQESAISEPQLPDHPGTQYLRKRADRTRVKVPSPQRPPSSLPVSAPTQGASLLTASEIQCVPTPLARARIQASVPQTKAPESGSPQLRQARVSRAGVSPAHRHEQVSSAGSAHALSTRPRTLQSQSSPPPAREPPQAVSQSTGTRNARGRIITAARSSSDTPSATRSTGRGLSTRAPPTAPGGADKRTTSSSRGMLGVGTTSRGMSQRSRDSGGGDSEKGDGDKDSVVSQAAVIKDSTTAKTASRLSSRSHSPMPPRSTGRGLGTGAPPTAPGGADKRTTPSSRRFLGVSTTSSGMSQRSRDSGGGDSEKGDGDKESVAPQAAVIKDSITANTASRFSSRSHSPMPPSRPVSSLQGNAREKATTRPGARPVWRG